MYTFTITAITILAAKALAAPTVGTICDAVDNYSDVASGQPWTKAPQIAGGYRCTSDDTDTCSLGSSITFSQGVDISVSGGISAGLNLGKILTLGLAPSVSYSWSTSTATGESANVQCPAGQLTCGVQVIASMVTTTGTRCEGAVPAGCGGVRCGHFSVDAPEQQGDGPNESLKTVMDFQACLIACQDGTTTCAAAKTAGIPICPGS